MPIAQQRLSRPRRLLAAATVLVAAAGAMALAEQPAGRPRRGAPPPQPQTPASTTGQPGAATPAQTPGQPGGASPSSAEEGPKPGPYVTPGREREWTLTARVNIRAFQDPGIARLPGNSQPDEMPTIDVFKFDTMTVVWPIVNSSASSSLAIPVEQGHTPTLSKYRFTVDDHDATGLPEFRAEVVTTQAGGKPYHSGVWLAMFKLNRRIVAREVEFEVTIPTRSWETRFDEAAANRVPWPTGDWPEEAASTLQPMLFIDYAPGATGGTQALNNRPIQDLLRQWNSGKDPRSVPPVVYAKWIAGQMAEHIQISGLGLAANRNGLLEGVALQTPTETVTTGRGSEFDLCVALTAAYRMSGLPARLVVGYDTQADARDEPGFLDPRSGGSGDLRCWVEFALFDEPHNTLNWVPVDIVKIRQSSSSLPAGFMDVGGLRYFGTNDELDDVVPFAFQFFPPTTVRSYGSPGFWGWFVTPEAPGRAWQEVSIRASSTPRSGR